MKDRILAYADEFGNNSFKFEKQGTHFIVATVIVKSSKIDEVVDQLEVIRKKHFQTGEIKSQKVARNHDRRIRVLNELVQLDFSLYAVIVDKKKLFGEGFKYKQSFYKFLNGLLYKELFRTFPELTLTVDEHGGNDYMKSFKKYVRKHHQRTLFSGSDFEIQDSSKSILIQLADFIAGTLGYIYDETKKSERSDEFYELLETKASSYSFFPKEYSFQEIQETIQDDTFNPTVAQLSYQRALDFLDTAKSDSQEMADQINCIKLLVLYLRASHKNRFISTGEIVRHLSSSRSEPIKEQYFRTKVVGKLRDKGVLIASSKDSKSGGYKLPTSTQDLKKFISHGNRIILPMLNRIKVARDAIKLATNNELDILESEEFTRLKTLVDNR